MESHFDMHLWSIVEVRASATCIRAETSFCRFSAVICWSRILDNGGFGIRSIRSRGGWFDVGKLQTYRTEFTFYQPLE